VLSATDANLWLDHGITSDQAVEIARTSPADPDDFVWYEVIARPDGNDPRLVVPVA
jgi:hypothetical protein